MADEAVPPYRSPYDDLVFRQSFAPARAELIRATAKQFCKVIAKHFNQEEPMNQYQTPKPTYVPGDRVLCLNPSMSIGEPGTIEVVFIGFDPEQPTVALVRDVGNVNAPIRGVHNSYIKAVPKPKHKVIELFARRNANKADLAVIEHVSDLDRFTDIPLRIIAARVTGDGLLQVKVDMDSAVEHEAIIAAHRNPCVDFTSKKANPFPYPSTTH